MTRRSALAARCRVVVQHDRAERHLHAVLTEPGCRLLGVEMEAHRWVRRTLELLEIYGGPCPRKGG